MKGASAVAVIFSIMVSCYTGKTAEHPGKPALLKTIEIQHLVAVLQCCRASDNIIQTHAAFAMPAFSKGGVYKFGGKRIPTGGVKS